MQNIAFSARTQTLAKCNDIEIVSNSSLLAAAAIGSAQAQARVTYPRDHVVVVVVVFVAKLLQRHALVACCCSLC